VEEAKPQSRGTSSERADLVRDAGFAEHVLAVERAEAVIVIHARFALDRAALAGAHVAERVAEAFVVHGAGHPVARELLAFALGGIAIVVVAEAGALLEGRVALAAVGLEGVAGLGVSADVAAQPVFAAVDRVAGIAASFALFAREGHCRLVAVGFGYARVCRAIAADSDELRGFRADAEAAAPAAHAHGCVTKCFSRAFFREQAGAAFSDRADEHPFASGGEAGLRGGAGVASVGADRFDAGAGGGGVVGDAAEDGVGEELEGGLEVPLGGLASRGVGRVAATHVLLAGGLPELRADGVERDRPRRSGAFVAASGGEEASGQDQREARTEGPRRA